MSPLDFFSSILLPTIAPYCKQCMWRLSGLLERQRQRIHFGDFQSADISLSLQSTHGKQYRYKQVLLRQPWTTLCSVLNVHNLQAISWGQCWSVGRLDLCVNTHCSEAGPSSFIYTVRLLLSISSPSFLFYAH